MVKYFRGKNHRYHPRTLEGLLFTCHVKAFLSIELSAAAQPLRKISSMKGASGYAALAVLGLMLVAANAEVFFQEDFTGGCLRAVRCCCPLAPLRAVRARTHASCVARSTWR